MSGGIEIAQRSKVRGYCPAKKRQRPKLDKIEGESERAREMASEERRRKARLLVPMRARSDVQGRRGPFVRWKGSGNGAVAIIEGPTPKESPIVKRGLVAIRSGGRH